MKPRFSILTLMGVTAYLAVVFAGLASPAALSIIWLAMLLAAVCSVVVLRDTSELFLFARGFLFTAAMSPLLFLALLAACWLGSEIMADWRESGPATRRRYNVALDAELKSSSERAATTTSPHYSGLSGSQPH
jgi:hypothetical protein